MTKDPDSLGVIDVLNDLRARDRLKRLVSVARAAADETAKHHCDGGREQATKAVFSVGVNAVRDAAAYIEAVIADVEGVE